MLPTRSVQDARQIEAKKLPIFVVVENLHFCSRERDIHSDQTVAPQCFQNQES